MFLPLSLQPSALQEFLLNAFTTHQIKVLRDVDPKPFEGQEHCITWPFTKDVINSSLVI
jgi:hypothetical protein